jgi:hypothetical protein
MSDEKRYAIAKEYVDKQLDTMKKFDPAPKDISRAEYDSLIKEVAQTIKPPRRD